MRARSRGEGGRDTDLNAASLVRDPQTQQANAVVDLVYSGELDLVYVGTSWFGGGSLLMVLVDATVDCSHGALSCDGCA